MLGGGNDINDQITFRRLHSNVSLSPEYESTPAPCLLPIHPALPPLPASTLLVSYAFQH